MALSDEQLNQIVQKYQLSPASNPSQNSNSLRGADLLKSLEDNNDQNTNSNTISEQPQQKQDGFFKGLAKDVLKPFAEVGTAYVNTKRNASNVIDALGNEYGKTGSVLQTIKNAATGKVMAKDSSQQTLNIPFLGETKPAFTGQETTGDAAKKIAGYGLEIGSYINPESSIEKLGAKALGKTALKFGTASALGDLGRQLQGDEPINKMELLKSGLIGSAVPVVGRGASKLVKGVGNVGAELLGKTTGTSGDVIKEAFSNPNVIKFARQAGSKGANDLQKQALEEAQQGLKQIVKKRGDEYVGQLEKIKGTNQEVQQVLNNTRDTAKQLLSDFDIKLNEGKKLNNLNFENSTITKNNEIVQKSFNDVMSWTDTSAAGLDRLKKRLTQYANDIPATERGGAHSFITDLKNNLNNGLKENVPGYREMTSKYAQATELIDEVEKALSLKDTASQDTAIRKLMSTTKENNDLRKEFVDILSGASGTDIRGKLAGSALAPNFAGGLSGKIAQAAIPGAGVAHYLNPSAVPLIGAYIAASSPRLMGEFTSLIGKATKPMIRANKFAPQIENGLRVLLQRSLNEK